MVCPFPSVVRRVYENQRLSKYTRNIMEIVRRDRSTRCCDPVIELVQSRYAGTGICGQNRNNDKIYRCSTHKLLIAGVEVITCASKCVRNNYYRCDYSRKKKRTVCDDRFGRRRRRRADGRQLSKRTHGPMGPWCAFDPGLASVPDGRRRSFSGRLARGRSRRRRARENR